MRGRPKKPKGMAKTTYVRIRVTPSERAEVRRRSKAANTATEADWIRQRLLGDG